MFNFSTAGFSLWSLCAALLFVFGFFPLARGDEVGDLRVEWRNDPVGIDRVQPSVSWRFYSDRPKAAQTAYQVEVATDKGLLNREQPDLWDSGKVPSDHSMAVPYAGKALETDRRVFWRVRIWDEAGNSLSWSEAGSWIPGILDVDNEWKAQWIGLDQTSDYVPQDKNFFGTDEAVWISAKPGASPVTYYLKTFDLTATSVKRVMLGAVCEYDGRVFVNGVEIMQTGDTAGVSPPRYMDITPWIKDGKNVISLWCVSTAAIRAGLRVEGQDGRVDFVRTDATWTAACGEIDLWDIQKSLSSVTTPVNGLDPGHSPQKKMDFGPAAVFQPASYLRNEFRLDKPVQAAVLHAAALGLCDLYVNGNEIGKEDHFKPGWSQFGARRNYVSYDVTSQLKTGVNAWGATLADGWYRGNIAWMGRCQFGDQTRFAAQLHVRYMDGTTQVFTTGPDWRATFSPYTMADIDCGEDYDARAEIPGWNVAGFNTANWRKVDVGTRRSTHVFDVTSKLKDRVEEGQLNLVIQNDLIGLDPFLGKQKVLTVKYLLNGKTMSAIGLEGSKLSIGNAGANLEILEGTYGYDPSVVEHPFLSARLTDPVHPTSELKPLAITEPKPGIYVFDFGQNAAAWTRLHVTGKKKGQTILIRYGEFLNPDGTIATINLRAINPHERYICSGAAEEIHEARFTYHGFRYAQVVGLSAKPDESTLTSITANSAGPVTSTFETSSPLVNRIYQAIVWSQRSNFFEVPTDCPQRDERLGWTGDFQFFGESASFNQDAASFFRKWIEIQTDAQTQNGEQAGSFNSTVPAPDRGWSTLDWNMSLLRAAWLSHWMYGDDQFVKEHWTGIRNFMNFYEHTMDTSAVPKVLGDWLSCAPVPTPLSVINDAQAVEAYDLFARMAKNLGYVDDAEHFRWKTQQAREAFGQKRVTPDGIVEGDTLTGYAMAVALHTTPDANEEAIHRNLIRVFEQGNDGMYCGFAGASRILPALTEAGRSDLATKALLKTEYPSLGFMIKNGATTTWETWGNAAHTDRNDLNNRGMSQNHYTFASSGAWLFEHLLGISPAAPGFKVIHFEPEIVHDLDFAKGSILSPYGRVSAGWKRTGDQIVYQVVVPANASAEAFVPVKDSKSVTLNGAPLTGATKQGEKLLLMLSSGSYDVAWHENNG